MNTVISTTTRRRRRTQHEIDTIVARYLRGGATQRDLAQQHGICVGTIQNWLRRSKAPCSSAAEAQWIELIADVPKGDSSYRIEFPGGPTLVLGSGWRPAEVRELVQTLASK